MPAQTRYPTKYPGTFYIVGKAVTDGRPEKIYIIRYRKNGKLIEEKAGRQFQDDMTPARAAKLRAKKIDGVLPTNTEKRAAEEAEKAEKAAEEAKLTIAKLWDQYCETYPENKSLEHDKRKFDLHIRDVIGTKEPSELLPLDVDRLRLGLQKKGKRTQAARVLEILRRTVNYGVKRGLITPLPYKIEVPRLNNQTTEDLNQNQLKRLLKALDTDEDQNAANVMRMVLFTGMRRSEIFKLQWSDVDFERGFIRLKAPKGGRDQQIPLNDSARAVLEGINHKKNNPYVFPGKFKGTHLTDCRKSFKRIAKAVKLPKGFRPLHGLRHVYASMLASSGKVDMYTLQKLLTHKSPIMTQRYAHLRDEALKNASNLAGELISEITNADTKKKTTK